MATPVRILPRRYLIHPTMQPIQQAMKNRKSPTVTFNVKSMRAAVSEYRESAALLRDLGLVQAADLLDRTADALAPRAAGSAPIPVPPALENYDHFDDETVVRDVDDLVRAADDLNADTLSNAEIPE